MAAAAHRLELLGGAGGRHRTGGDHVQGKRVFQGLARRAAQLLDLARRRLGHERRIYRRQLIAQRPLRPGLPAQRPGELARFADQVLLLGVLALLDDLTVADGLLIVGCHVVDERRDLLGAARPVSDLCACLPRQPEQGKDAEANYHRSATR